MLYSYKCIECEYEVDFEFKITEDLPKKIKCPNCNKKSMKRVWANCKNIIVPFQWGQEKVVK